MERKEQDSLCESLFFREKKKKKEEKDKVSFTSVFHI